MTTTDATQSMHTTVALVAASIACVLVLAAAAYHARAASEFQASRARDIALEARYVHAYTAAALEPWNDGYTSRARYVAAWVRADRLLADGDYKEAVRLLAATAGRTLAEPDLLALYRRAQQVQTAETNRKAHLQHGHEGAGGTLLPEDIER